MTLPNIPFQPEHVREEGSFGNSGNTGVSGSGAAVTITLPAAGAGLCNFIYGVCWSYTAAPTGGNLIIQDGSTTIFQIDITAAGPGYIPFQAPLYGSTNTAMAAVLAAPGGSIVGKVNFVSPFQAPFPVSNPSTGGNFTFPQNAQQLIPVVL